MSSPHISVRAHSRLWRHLGTPSAIYGLLVYASLIAATAVHRGEDDTVGTILAFSAVTVVVFWIAHVYASALSHHGNAGAENVTLWQSIAHGATTSIGMLEAALVPTVPLVLGAVRIIEPRGAILWSLISATVMLGVLGFVAFALRDQRWWVRITGAIGTALFGVILIILEGSLH